MRGTLLWGICGAVLAFMGTTSPASAQARLFSDQLELQATIEGPIDALVRASVRSTDPYPAIFVLEGGAQRYDMQMSARGISRRIGGFCTFPPIRLDFDQNALRGTLLQGQNRLKLVTRCRAGGAYEHLTMLEYTAYRLYNEITPFSFRVRPVRVTYHDTDGRRRDTTQFNFLIEDVDDLARRNRRVALEVQTREVTSAQLDPDLSASVGLFQYMIGNLDWDMVAGPAGQECCHNGKLLALSPTSRENVAPIPFDFDFSGFVNAPYATPPEGIDVSNVRTRHYRGYCRHNDRLPAAAERFRARRAALYAIIDGETRLPESRRRVARRYIEGFFETLDDPERFNRQIVARCRG